MVEVLKGNFNEIYPDIVRDINDATFIAVDCEFTGGLHSSDLFKPSLFDNGLERYEKLQHCLSKFIILEFGISTFHFCRDQNKYVASTYNIHLFPRTFLSLNREFMCDPQALSFLAVHHFDFNKFVREGVSYLNEVEEAQLRHALAHWYVFQRMESVLMREDENVIQDVCSNICSWLLTAEQGASLNVSDIGLKKYPADISYIIHRELRTRFKNIWTYAEGTEIRVTKIDPSERCALENEEQKHGTLENNIMNYMLGFTRIFRLLSNVQKPVIGHNFLIDLMFMYKQFYRPLPVKYSDFKKNMHKLFPTIYDTKVLGSKLKNILSKTDKWQNNILTTMYEYFRSENGRKLAVCFPIVESAHYNLEDSNPRFHEAGWDSFCTGFCFVHMAQYLAIYKYRCINRPRPLTSSEHLNAVSDKKNKVNIVRARVNCVVLDGPDPKSIRPPLLIVQVKNSDDIDTQQVIETLAEFGTIDVKQHKRKSVLVAVANHGRVRDILTSFEGHPLYEVKIYTWKCYFASLLLEPWILGSATCGIGAALVFWSMKKF